MNIVISWNEIPIYGAYLIREALANTPHKITIISTKSPLPIPIQKLEDILGQRIVFIEKEKELSWSELNIEIPDIFFQAGWFINSYLSLGKEVKKNKGKVVLLSDNSRKKGLRQFVGSLVYRFKYSKLFDSVWVPGESGYELMRYFSVPSNQIFKGLYGSNELVFTPGPSLIERKKQLIFVGRLEKIKGIKELIFAFNVLYKKDSEWSLVIFGKGSFSDKLSGIPGVTLNSFASPDFIATCMKDSRFLVLPSHEDHWPLVVNEASLCGCGMLLSSDVGNAKEFIGRSNGFSFKSKSSEALKKVLYKMSELTDDQISSISDESVELGLKFTPRSTWGSVFDIIVKSLQ